MQKHVKNKQKTETKQNNFFLFSCNISSTSIPEKFFYNAHIKSHIDYASVVCDDFGAVQYT